MSIPGSIAAAARPVGGALMDLLFPPLCVGCEDRLPEVQPAVPLCPGCRRTLPQAPPDALEERLARLGDQAAILEHRLALWTFDEGGVLQSLQHTLKYRDRPSLGVQLGREIGRLWQAKGYPEPDRVVPVPLSRLRFLERGYNQAERLAVGIGSAHSVSTAELVVRSRPTRSQTKLSREERRRNVAGAFALAGDPAMIAGMRVLIVDDVLTTGATVIATAEPLHAAGAAVDLALLALTRE